MSVYHKPRQHLMNFYFSQRHLTADRGKEMSSHVLHWIPVSWFTDNLQTAEYFADYLRQEIQQEEMLIPEGF